MAGGLGPTGPTDNHATGKDVNLGLPAHSRRAGLVGALAALPFVGEMRLRYYLIGIAVLLGLLLVAQVLAELRGGDESSAGDGKE